MEEKSVSLKPEYIKKCDPMTNRIAKQRMTSRPDALYPPGFVIIGFIDRVLCCSFGGFIQHLLPSAGDDFCGVSVDELFVGLFAEKQAF